MIPRLVVHVAVQDLEHGPDDHPLRAAFGPDAVYPLVEGQPDSRSHEVDWKAEAAGL